MSVITGAQVDMFRLQVLKQGLGLELKGMKMSRGRSCYSIVKAEFGLKGNKQKVYEQFCIYVERVSNIK